MEETRSTAVIATTVAVTVALTSLARLTLWPQKRAVIPGPLSRIHKLSKDELAQVPYTPDAFPGARDVVTPVSLAFISVIRNK